MSDWSNHEAVAPPNFAPLNFVAMMRCDVSEGDGVWREMPGSGIGFGACWMP